MKPHYVLYKGRPERVGMLQGKKVVLVAVEPDPQRDGSRYCHQCELADCPTISDSMERLGRDCTQGGELVYKEVL